NALLEALNSVLSQAVETSQETGLTRVLSMKREFPDALHQLLSPARAATLTLRPEHFPYLFRDQGYQLQPVQPEVNARVVTKEALDDDAQLGLQLNDETGTGLQGLAENSQIRNLIEVDLVRSDTTPIVAGWQPEHWHLTQDGLDSSTVDDVLFVVRYRLEATDA